MLNAKHALATGVVVLALVAGRASPGTAHASLVAADPAPGAALSQPPGAVVVRFREPIDGKRSSLAVAGPDGHDVGTGPVERESADSRVLRLAVGIVLPGRYTVTWTSTSADDGHGEAGRYSFGVSTAAPAGRHAGTARSQGRAAAPTRRALGLLTEFLLAAGVLLWAGAVALDQPARRAGISADRMAGLRNVSAALALAAAVTRLGAGAGAILDLGRLGERSTVVIAVAAAIGMTTGRRPRFARGLVITALVALAAAGHAATGRLPVLAVAVLAIHIGAAGVWLAAMAAAMLAPRVRAALAVLSRAAIRAAAAVGISGAAVAVLQRVDPHQLVATAYGHLLVAKVVAFAGAICAGTLHLRRRRRGARARLVANALRIEATVAVLALVAAVSLAGSSPPTTFTGGLVGAAAPSVLGPIDGRDAASVADSTGPFVVGLTVAPARPGPVTVRVVVLIAQPAGLPSDVDVKASMAGTGIATVALAPVGPGVFAGRGRLVGEGSWAFSVSFRTRSATHQVTLAVPIPAAGGTGMLNEALAAAERLGSVAVHESVRSAAGAPPTVADYQFRAPDAFALSVNGTNEITVGARMYRRTDGRGPWTLEDTGTPFGWPSPYFRQAWAGATAVRIIGSEIVAGAPSHIVSFVRPDIPAWFELWVGDNDGLVRREEMRAQGHLMRHDYEDFDAPIAIVPPS